MRDKYLCFRDLLMMIIVIVCACRCGPSQAACWRRSSRSGTPGGFSCAAAHSVPRILSTLFGQQVQTHVNHMRASEFLRRLPLPPLLFCCRGGILRPPWRDPRGAPGNAPCRRGNTCLELRCVTREQLDVKAFSSFRAHSNQLRTKQRRAI